MKASKSMATAMIVAAPALAIGITVIILRISTSEGRLFQELVVQGDHDSAYEELRATTASKRAELIESLVPLALEGNESAWDFIAYSGLIDLPLVRLVLTSGNESALLACFASWNPPPGWWNALADDIGRAYRRRDFTTASKEAIVRLLAGGGVSFDDMSTESRRLLIWLLSDMLSATESHTAIHTAYRAAWKILPLQQVLKPRGVELTSLQDLRERVAPSVLALWLATHQASLVILWTSDFTEELQSYPIPGLDF